MKTETITYLQDILRITRLIQRFGLTPAQASTIAALAWGE